MEIQKISKLEAASRQLQAAIVLFFQNQDELCVHTVAGAAHGIIRDLLIRRDGAESVRVTGETMPPMHHAIVTRMVNEARNFLKHADRDPNQTLTFNPDWTDFLMFDAIRMHIRLASDLDSASILFLLWLSAKYPNVLLLDQFLSHGSQKLDELRRIFPALGGVDTQKQTFLAALNAQSPSSTVA